MDEYVTMYQITGGGVALVLASFMYSWGGRSGKWKRRFIASFILACTVNILCLLRGLWNPYMLLTYPFLIGGFSLGYGADTLPEKILRRSIYALACVFCGLIFCITLGGNAWWVLVAHVGIGAFSIFLGVKNPIFAPAEEFIICMLLNIGLICYPFVV